MPSFSKTMELAIETNFVGLTVRPGDKIVIAFSRSLSHSEAQEVRDVVQDMLPGVQGVILDDVAAMVVYQADPEQGAERLHPNQHAEKLEGM